jgi:hypothetical protein
MEIKLAGYCSLRDVRFDERIHRNSHYFVVQLLSTIRLGPHKKERAGE